MRGESRCCVVPEKSAYHARASHSPSHSGHSCSQVRVHIAKVQCHTHRSHSRVQCGTVQFYTCSCFSVQSSGGKVSGRLCSLCCTALCTLQCIFHCSVFQNLVFSVFSAANCETVQTDTVQTGKAALATKS